MRRITQIHTLFLFLLPSIISTTTHALPTELIPVPKGGIWSWSWTNGSFLGIPFIYLAAGSGGVLLLFIIMAVFFFFKKRREDQRYARLAEESGGEGILTSRGGVMPGTGAGTGAETTARSGGNGHGHHVVTYIYDERPLAPSSAQQQQHSAAFAGGGQARPQMSEIRHSTVYYSDEAPIQIQTHDPITGYPFPQGQVQFFELSTNAATITAHNNTVSSPTTERSEIDFKEDDGKDGEKKRALTLDQLPKHLYPRPPPELHHKLSSLSVASTATLPVSTPSHVHPEGGSEDDLKKGKVAAVVAVVAQAKKGTTPSPTSSKGTKDAKTKSKVQLRRDVSVSKNIKTKNAAGPTAKPKPFT